MKSATKNVPGRDQAGRRTQTEAGVADAKCELDPERETGAFSATVRRAVSAPVLSSRRANMGLPIDGEWVEQGARNALRPALLAGAAACALSLAALPSPARAQAIIVNPPGTVPSQCDYDADENSVVCEGDLDDGLEFTTGADLTNITVRNPTNAIAPAIGVDAVYADVSGDENIVVTIDTNGQGIVARSADGVDFNMDGAGSLTLNSTSDITVTGDVGAGIFAYQESSGDISLTSTGNIQAVEKGVYANSDGGAVSVVSDGDITAGSRGIDIEGSSRATVESTGNITAGTVGIRADALGAASVTSDGNIVVNGGRGISMLASTGAATVVVKGGNIEASADGVYAASGQSNTTVTSYGGINAGFDGIVARSGQGNALITSRGDVDAEQDGISASSSQGSASVTSYGGIDAGFDGIDVEGAAGVSVKSFGEYIIAGDRGIEATASGGTISIESSSAITVGDETHGIYAKHAGGGAITIDVSGSITAGGESYGVYAYSATGAITIDSAADIIAGGDGYGIRAFSSGDNVAVDSFGAVTVGASGVGVGASSTSEYGTVAVGVYGAVAAGYAGVRAESEDGAVTVTVGAEADITAGNAEGGFGIKASSGGDGDVTIRSAADIEAKGSEGYGVYALSRGGDIDIVSNGTVSGGLHGINARAVRLPLPGVASGGVRIDSTGAVSGDDGAGITAYAYEGDVTIVSDGDVSGYYDGIIATSNYSDVAVTSVGDIEAAAEEDARGIYARGVGTISINSTGNITVDNDDDGVGIKAYVEDDGTDVSIVSDGDVTAGGVGVYASTGEGSGNIVIDLSGDVTGQTSYGVDAYATDGDVTITANGDVYGGTVGVRSVINGTGDTMITLGAAATVTGGSGAGVTASSSDAESTITVQGSSGAIVGAADGTYLRTVGAALTVQNLDSVTGEDGDGLDLASQGGAITISGVDKILGTGGIGIYAVSDGGDVSIQGVGLNGGVTGADGPGIYVSSGTGSIDIGGTTAIGDVTGSGDAIYAYVESEGDITVSANGAVTAQGADGVGVHVVAAAGSSNAVTIGADGAVTGGSGAGAGVRFTDGATNRLENRGTIAALSGVAVEGAAGVERFVNYGTLEGAVSLAAGNDVFELYGEGDVSAAGLDGGEGADVFRLAGTGAGVLSVGGLQSFEIFEKTGAGTWSLVDDYAFATSADILSGVLDLQGALTSPIVTNSGSIAVGGVGIIGAGTIDGDFVQKAGADYQIDIDFTNSTVDLLSVTGTASLAGAVTPNVLSLSTGEQELTILTADGGVTNNGLILSPFASPLVDASLAYPNANDVVLSVTIAFTLDNIQLSDNQTALADNLSYVLDASAASGIIADGSDASIVVDTLLFDIDSEAAYINALDQLMPSILLSVQTVTLYFAEVFSNSLFSCDDKASVRSVTREGECLWFKVSGGLLEVDGEAQSTSFDDETVSVSAGWQREVAENWRIGVAAGYETSSIDNAVGALSDGERMTAGVSVKHLRGPLRLSAALSGGIGDYETTRSVSFGGFSDTLLSEQDVAHAALQARLAYRQDFTGWYVQPYVDVNWTWVSLGDVTESGGAAALAIDGEDETFFSVTPGLELGADLVLSDSFVLRPFLRGGASFYASNEFGMAARFIGAPAGDVGFANVTAIDDLYADVQAGVTLFNIRGQSSQSGGRFGDLGRRASFSLVYEGRYGENTKQNGAFIKAAFPF